MKGKQLILFFLILTAGSVLLAQDKAFTASAPASVQVGQQFQYTINGNDQGDVTLPALEKFDLLAGPFSSFSSQSQWINGKMSMSTVVSYTYIYRAREEGEFTIAPATIRTGRKSYETNEVHITVTKGTSPVQSSGNQAGQNNSPATSGGTGEDESLFMRILPSKNEVYLGEQFTAGLKIYTSVNTQPGENIKEAGYEGFYSQTIDPDKESSMEAINGTNYVTQVIQRQILIPQKTGDITIQPQSMDWIVQKRTQRRRTGSIFDDPFFSSGYENVPVTLTTKPVTIHVRPLPVGAPDGFKGAVGNFTMKAELSQKEVKVNEALSLKITVSGTGNLNLLSSPDVSLPPDHDIYDVTKKLNTDVSGNRISGSVTFEYPIIARHSGKYRISPVKFSWFDPATGTYKTQTSSEFVFSVLKGEGGEDMNGQIFIPGIQGNRVDDIGTDIRDIIRTAPSNGNFTTLLFSSAGYKLFYPVIVVFFFLFIILQKNRIKRNADLKMVKNRKAGRIARERLKVADKYRKAGDTERFYEETGKAVWLYLADKLLIDLSQLSRDVVTDKLIAFGISREKADELMKIIDACEFARFAPASERDNIDSVFKETLSLIKSIEESL